MDWIYQDSSGQERSCSLKELQDQLWTGGLSEQTMVLGGTVRTWRQASAIEELREPEDDQPGASAEWYFVDQSAQEAGPYSLDELHSQNLSTLQLVRCDGMDDWQPYGKVFPAGPPQKREITNVLSFSASEEDDVAVHVPESQERQTEGMASAPPAGNTPEWNQRCQSQFVQRVAMHGWVAAQTPHPKDSLPAFNDMGQESKYWCEVMMADANNITALAARFRATNLEQRWVMVSGRQWALGHGLCALLELQPSGHTAMYEATMEAWTALVELGVRLRPLLDCGLSEYNLFKKDLFVTTSSVAALRARLLILHIMLAPSPYQFQSVLPILFDAFNAPSDVHGTLLELCLLVAGTSEEMTSGLAVSLLSHVRALPIARALFFLLSHQTQWLGQAWQLASMVLQLGGTRNGAAGMGPLLSPSENYLLEFYAVNLLSQGSQFHTLHVFALRILRFLVRSRLVDTRPVRDSPPVLGAGFVSVLEQMQSNALITELIGLIQTLRDKPPPLPLFKRVLEPPKQVWDGEFRPGAKIEYKTGDDESGSSSKGNEKKENISKQVRARRVSTLPKAVVWEPPKGHARTSSMSYSMTSERPIAAVESQQKEKKKGFSFFKTLPKGFKKGESIPENGPATNISAPASRRTSEMNVETNLRRSSIETNNSFATSRGSETVVEASSATPDLTNAPSKPPPPIASRDSSNNDNSSPLPSPVPNKPPPSSVPTKAPPAPSRPPPPPVVVVAEDNHEPGSPSPISPVSSSVPFKPPPTPTSIPNKPPPPPVSVPFKPPPTPVSAVESSGATTPAGERVVSMPFKPPPPPVKRFSEEEPGAITPPSTSTNSFNSSTPYTNPFGSFSSASTPQEQQPDSSTNPFSSPPTSYTNPFDSSSQPRNSFNAPPAESPAARNSFNAPEPARNSFNAPEPARNSFNAPPQQQQQQQNTPFLNVVNTFNNNSTPLQFSEPVNPDADTRKAFRSPSVIARAWIDELNAEQTTRPKATPEFKLPEQPPMTTTKPSTLASRPSRSPFVHSSSSNNSNSPSGVNGNAYSSTHTPPNPTLSRPSSSTSSFSSTHLAPTQSRSSASSLSPSTHPAPTQSRSSASSLSPAVVSVGSSHPGFDNLASMPSSVAPSRLSASANVALSTPTPYSLSSSLSTPTPYSTPAVVAAPSVSAERRASLTNTGEPFRTFTSATGVKTELLYLNFLPTDNSKIVFRWRDGRLCHVPLDKLSKEDRDWLHARFRTVAPSPALTPAPQPSLPTPPQPSVTLPLANNSMSDYKTPLSSNYSTQFSSSSVPVVDPLASLLGDTLKRSRKPDPPDRTLLRQPAPVTMAYTPQWRMFSSPTGISKEMQFLKKFERAGVLMLEMKMRDGKLVTMPIDKLCSDDQKWVRDQADPQSSLVDLFSTPLVAPPPSSVVGLSLLSTPVSAYSSAPPSASSSSFAPLPYGLVRQKPQLTPAWPLGLVDLLLLETGQTIPAVGEKVSNFYSVLTKVPGPEEAAEWKERFTENNFAVCNVLALLLVSFEANPDLRLIQPPDPVCPSNKLIELLLRAMYVVPKPMSKALVVNGAVGRLSAIICLPTPPRPSSMQTICRLLETTTRCCGRKHLAAVPRGGEICFNLFELFGKIPTAEVRILIVNILVLLNHGDNKERLVHVAARSPTKDKLASMVCLAVQKRGTPSSVLRALWAFIAQVLDPKKAASDFFSRDILDKFVVSLLGQIQDYMEVPKLLTPALVCLHAVVSRSMPPDTSVLTKVVARVSQKYGASNPAITQVVRALQTVVR